MLRFGTPVPPPRDMCYSPLKNTPPHPRPVHILASPGQHEPPSAPLCPPVAVFTMSHIISSCQILPVAPGHLPGHVPTHIVPSSVSRPRQLLDRVTPCYSGLPGDLVAREVVFSPGIQLLSNVVLCSLFFFFPLLSVQIDL